jgi:hypothetical protein
MAVEIFKGNIEPATPRDHDEDDEDKEAGICCLNCSLIVKFDNTSEDLKGMLAFVSEHEGHGHEVYAGIFEDNEFIPKGRVRGPRQ